MTHTAHTALVFLGLVRLASLVPLLFLPLPCLTTMAKQNKWIIDLYQLLSTICINYETNICYILQKVKSSTNIYYGFRVEPSLHTFIQLVIEAFTSRETWTRSLLVVNGRHTASFLRPETIPRLQIAQYIEIFPTTNLIV